MISVATAENQVKRRRVFYIPGYDPMPPRRYRELYRTEGAAQAEISGYDIGVSAGITDSDFSWNVAAHIDGADVAARVDVLRWTDIVTDSMSGTIPATYLQLLKTAWIYIGTGTLRRLMWMRKGPVIAAFYPVALLLLQLIFALWLGVFLGGNLRELVLWIFSLIGVNGAATGFASVVWQAVWWLTTVIKYAILFGVTYFLLRWFKSKDNKLFAYYLMHDYAFSAAKWGVYPPELDERIDVFADKIAQALQPDVQEVLVVGHSSGAFIAVSALARLLRDDRLPNDGPELALLSLGQVIPMVSFLPEATQLRADLAYLAEHDWITWVDVSAPGDGCSFALCDPVSVSGVATEEKRWPLVISAAYTQALSEARWKELRWRFFRLHFQYLCAFDRPKDYDYFQITAGPLTLADRYRGRSPSRSRVDIPVSKYTRRAK